MNRPSVRIVGVHGNGGGASRFARMAAHVPDDVELHAVTLPGFSTVPRDPALRTLADYADRLGEMLDAGVEAAGHTVLLGHGIGGSIALDLVSRRPDLVDGLILHAPVGASLDTRLFPRIMSSPTVRALVKRVISSPLPRPLLRRVFFPQGAPKDILDRFFDEYRHCAAFGDMFELINRPWFDGVQPILDVPAVLLWGADDRVLRSGQADEFKVKVPGAETVVRDGWDHFPMIEQPGEYADEIVAMARRLVSAKRSA
ncbi:MAG: alpha/beta hydrolase [Acidimicrobiia bacterium]|nr:alpha/beta hydrolase [Acidimicrobiia bacterium]